MPTVITNAVRVMVHHDQPAACMTTTNLLHPILSATGSARRRSFPDDAHKPKTKQQRQ
eukprot:CAMPEP_0202026296 /NCGR_PEP_ID=MMETSP0905-20130828/58566_1 /ASSEMBLY_ACC=CAM_ASM_000554 /TAXON_ID=420261 /ORGANISM="Thalassiosira antarctica, Strain CCMP982" /LENGTH=57 /DNA_ID=CAMNT_0048589469 /DNA_START=41 /DNA_END=211 /DNA_ORIENTATION=+